MLEVGGAGQCVQSAADLVRVLVEYFDDLEACRVRGEIGRETLEAHRGSVERTCSMIEEVLARRSVGGARIPQGEADDSGLESDR
jgi:hypothetical protein